jgi:hypothetical protein
MSKKTKKRTKKKAKAFRKAAASGIGKFKEAAEFIYAHRDEIKEAAKLVAAVLGTASQILGKPGRKSSPKRARRKGGQPANLD